MKEKFIMSNFCILFLSIQISFSQLIVTNYNNNFQSSSCTSVSEEWVKCACNSGTWPKNLQAPFEWQQIGGPSKIFGISGTVGNSTIAGSDFPFSHVFGYNPSNPNSKLYTDWESYIVVDAPYISLLGKGNASKDKNNNPIPGEYNDAITNVKNMIKGLNGIDKRYATIEAGVMGVEFESGLIPEVFRSKIGDRTAVFGDLIVDCGHDDGGFHTEIHPPLMLVNSRSYDGANPLNHKQLIPENVSPATVSFSSIISRAFMINQLYNSNGNAGNGLTFMNAASIELFKAISNAEGWGFLTGFLAPTYHLTMNADIPDKPFRGFQSMSFDVYPQGSPEAGDLLWSQYHFTVRNGVSVNIQKADDHISINVTMDESKYNSPNNLLKKHNRDLDKDDFNKMGFGDVYAYTFLGTALIPGLNADLIQGIQSTVYESLNVEPNETIYPSNLNQGVIADISDDQPFPISGWITVGWAKPIPIKGPCVVNPIQFNSSVEKINFMPDDFTKSQLVTLSNPTDQPIQLGQLSVEGQDKSRFLLQSKTIILLRPGMQQPAEDISGTVIPPHGSAAFRIAIANPVQQNLMATIIIPSQGCELKIPVREFNSFVQ